MASKLPIDDLRGLDSMGRILLRDDGGVKILLEKDNTFLVTDNHNYTRKNSYYEAEQLLDKRKKDLIDKEDLQLKVLDPLGREGTLTGFHMNTGDWIGKFQGKFEGAFGTMDKSPHTVYPQVSWIQELLIRKAELSRELEEIQKKISPFEIRKIYGRTAREDYNENIAKLKYEFEGLTRKAEGKNE